MLYRSPFNIESNETALLVARYLIENNSTGFVDFHVELTTNV